MRAEGPKWREGGVATSSGVEHAHRPMPTSATLLSVRTTVRFRVAWCSKPQHKYGPHSSKALQGCHHFHKTFSCNAHALFVAHRVFLSRRMVCRVEQVTNFIQHVQHVSHMAASLPAF